MGFKFDTSVLGGTFDHFHKGHKKLIDCGLSLSERLIIGITSDEYVKKLKTNNEELRTFENFEIRKKSVEGFLNNITPGRFEILEIEDLLGPTLDKSFQADAIIVSQQTKDGALKINEERLRKDLGQLKIEISPNVLTEDGKLISSLRIRNGEIDRNGKLYIDPSWTRSDLVITDEIRSLLKKPLGKLLAQIDAENFKNFEGSIISVGDETSRILNELKISADISVIDFKIAREKRFSDIKELGFLGDEEVVKVGSPAGIISKDLLKVVTGIFGNTTKKRRIILIDGEDDLSVLPLILASPLGNCIFYGQPEEGIVKIDINEQIKARIHKIVSKFNTRGY
ncbi:MAG: pantetheine-phosphate adenylyltransferase [Patescibacteria group bacterium]